jgi:hypothetical protein
MTCLTHVPSFDLSRRVLNRAGVRNATLTVKREEHEKAEEVDVLIVQFHYRLLKSISKLFVVYFDNTFSSFSNHLKITLKERFFYLCYARRLKQEDHIINVKTLRLKYIFNIHFVYCSFLVYFSNF